VKYLYSMAILVVSVALLTVQITTSARISRIEKSTLELYHATDFLSGWVTQVSASQDKLAEAVKTSTNSGMAAKAQMPAVRHISHGADTVWVTDTKDTITFYKELMR
jgi:hypothetical protein